MEKGKIVDTEDLEIDLLKIDLSLCPLYFFVYLQGYLNPKLNTGCSKEIFSFHFVLLIDMGLHIILK